MPIMSMSEELVIPENENSGGFDQYIEQEESCDNITHYVSSEDPVHLVYETARLETKASSDPWKNK